MRLGCLRNRFCISSKKSIERPLVFRSLFSNNTRKRKDRPHRIRHRLFSQARQNALGVREAEKNLFLVDGKNAWFYTLSITPLHAFPRDKATIGAPRWPSLPGKEAHAFAIASLPLNYPFIPTESSRCNWIRF